METELTNPSLIVAVAVALKLVATPNGASITAEVKAVTIPVRVVLLLSRETTSPFSILALMLISCSVPITFSKSS